MVIIHLYTEKEGRFALPEKRLSVICNPDSWQGDFSGFLFDIQSKMEYPYPWAGTVQALYYAAFIIFNRKDLHLNMEPQKTKTLLYEAALLLVGLIWGGGFMATRIAVDEQLSASLILAGRFLIAAIIFGCVFWKTIRKNFTHQAISSGMIVGTFLFLGFATQTMATAGTVPSSVGFLTAINVIIVPFLWWAIAKKRPSRRIVAACILCLCGIGVLSLKLDGFSFSAGNGLALACSFFFACHIVFTGIFSVRVNPNTLVFVQFVTAALLSILFFLVLDRDYTPLLHPRGFLSVAYLGVFSTCLCFFLQSIAQVHVPASKAALFLCTESLFCSIFSVLLRYEPLTLSMAAGGAMIFASVLIAEYTPAHREDTQAV